MPLMNYTSTVKVESTIGDIQAMLVKAGARSIAVDYDDDGEPIALAFQIQTNIGSRSYRLPANIDAALAILIRQHKQRAGHRAFPTRGQAARTGWRIIKDWVEAQLALLETSMATLPEIMLPWMIAGRDGETMYQLFERQQLALPGGK